VELKNGETYNGHLVNCDTWMNIHLREVICTSKVLVFLVIYLIFGVFVLKKKGFFSPEVDTLGLAEI
jgi:small nuclear ribonucleoprotein (snRNP)-like protein